MEPSRASILPHGATVRVACSWKRHQLRARSFPRITISAGRRRLELRATNIRVRSSSRRLRAVTTAASRSTCLKISTRPPFTDQTALTLVNLSTGRAKSRIIADGMAGSELLHRGTTKVELQAGVLNVFDSTPC